MSNPAPPVSYTSTRLVGLELELDSPGSQPFRAPVPVRGWSKKTDGSLRNGFEYVLEPAVALSEVGPKISAFCDAVTAARTNIGTRGGFHVHVQSADYCGQGNEWWRLVQIYRHFQPAINQMVGESRAHNTYAPPYRDDETRSSICERFKLDRPAHGRDEAKVSRSYSVVNLAMVRCVVPGHRSIEFRQLSPSRRYENVMGWAQLLTGFVELGAHSDPSILSGALANEKSIDGMCAWLNHNLPGSGLAEWAQWRFEWMTERPTDELVARTVNELRIPHGIFHISRALGVNLPLAKRLLERATSLGLARATTGQKYIANYAGGDLAELEMTMLPTVPSALPTVPSASVYEVPVEELEATLGSPPSPPPVTPRPRPRRRPSAPFRPF